jgi:hypothetical protein
MRNLCVEIRCDVLREDENKTHTKILENLLGHFQ